MRWILVLLALLFVSSANATKLEGLLKKGHIPIHIKARQLEAFEKKGLYKLSGNVVVTRGDMRLSADKMDVYRDPETGQLVKIVCLGHVVMRKDSRVATADKAIYNEKQQKVTLIGNAFVKSARNSIKSQIIVYYLDRDYAVAQSGKGRVEVTIYPEKKLLKREKK